MRLPPFRFGICLSPVFGSVASDMLDLPEVQMDINAKDMLIGGSSTSLTGVKTVDRIALKRSWTIALGPDQAMVTWWPVLRLWEVYRGPWQFYDHTRPNLLSGNQRLMQTSTWANAAGTVLVPRSDGTITLAVGGAAQLGPTSSPARALLIPVTAGAQYTAAMTVLGATTAFTGTLGIRWFDAASGAALSTSSVSVAGTSPNTLVRDLDGSVFAPRFATTVTAPAGALYAQLFYTSVTGIVDISDPCLIPGSFDPGNAMFVVNIDDVMPIYNQRGYATLSMQLSEV